MTNDQIRMNKQRRIITNDQTRITKQLNDQILITRPRSMNETPKSQHFDLEERTFWFAVACRDFSQSVPKMPANFEYGKQLVRSSGSTAANYIEANESLSRKDFFHRIRICRKEAKESRLWLRLMLLAADAPLLAQRDELIQESLELGRIFTAILQKDNEKGR